MKVIKPQRLGLLTRPFEVADGCRLSVGLLAFVGFDAPRALLSEVGLWKFAAQELGDTPLDPGMPKTHAEYLVHGRAFAPGGTPVRGVGVRATVGARVKTLHVLGDRYWNVGYGAAPSEPTPFVEMPLSWDRAFGGAGFSPNPIGRGAAEVPAEGGATLHPLPNIEDPRALIVDPSDRPAPVGFGPIDPMWPQRARKAGTYDDAWLKSRFPALPDDLDWTYFNLAPQDQWFDRHPVGPQRFAFENLHPTRPRVEGELPALVGRCFLTRRSAAGDELVEVPTRLETVWFFPHAERAVMLFRGVATIAEDDAHDVAHLVAAFEDPEAPKPLAHYRDVLAARLDPERGVLLALRDHDLMPDWGDAAKPPVYEEGAAIATFENASAKNARRKAEREIAHRRAWLVTLGLDPDEHGPKPLPPEPETPTLEQLPMIVQQVQDDAKTLEAEERRLHAAREVRIRALAEENGVPWSMIEEERSRPTGGPPTFTAEGKMGELRAIATRARADGHPIDEIEGMLVDEALWAQYREAEQKMRDAYRLSAHLQPEAPEMDPLRSDAVRVAVMEAYAARQDITGLDLTGARLPGIDLRGADLSHSFLERADLRNADLRGATLVNCVLARADLRGAQLQGAVLRGANLGLAALADANLGDGVDLSGATLYKADLTRASLRGAKLDQTDLLEATLVGADLSGADAPGLTLLKCRIDGTSFARALLDRASFLEAEGEGVDLRGARLERATFFAVKLPDARFDHALMVNARIVRGSALPRARFTGAVLRRANLRGATLTEGDFTGADLTNADLSECELSRATLLGAVAQDSLWVRAVLRDADLTGVDLMRAVMQKADLRGACLERANLFAADLARVYSTDRTRYDGANLKKVRIHPVRRAT